MTTTISKTRSRRHETTDSIARLNPEPRKLGKPGNPGREVKLGKAGKVQAADLGEAEHG